MQFHIPYIKCVGVTHENLYNYRNNAWQILIYDHAYLQYGTCIDNTV